MKQKNDAPLFIFVEQIIHKKGWIEIPAHGSSMYPLIREGNICRFHQVQHKKIRKGDVILFHSSSGELIAHRLHTFVQQQDKELYLCKGDSNLGMDEPISFKQILGVLYSIRKTRKDILMTDLRIALWSKAMVTLPFLSRGVNRYLSRKKAQATRGTAI
ncbi:MAG: signal peptidase I [Gorillibacterium sp.]|nr:signal peptidase I [Gorillibacterium sp.]